MKKVVVVVGIVVVLVVGILVLHRAKSNTPHSSSSSRSSYKNGVYDGSVANAYYGNVQVQADIQSGKIVSVKFLQYPNLDQTSILIAQQVMPYLQKEAIKSQNANVDVISGATYTSQAFIQSLTAALQKA